jgi:hypothetical protein
MTITSETARNDYIGDGSTATYAYTFKAFQDADLKVVKTITGVDSTLVLTTDYTVTGAGEDAGGTVVLTAGNLTSGHGLSIQRQVAFTQTRDIRNQGTFYADQVMAGLDKLTMLAQQLEARADRSLQVPDGEDSVAVLPGAASRASSLLGFDANGSPVMAGSLPENANSALVTSTGSVTERTLATRFADVVNVKDFGAVGDGVADDIVQIQAAIDAAYAAGGGLVYVPPGTYRITTSINMRSYVKLFGVYGEDNTFGVVGSKNGSEIKWDGAVAGDPIIRAFSARLFEIDGIHLDGDNKDVVGILLDSDNNPSGSQNEIRRFSIRKCLVGVKWGTSGIAGGSFANDGTRFSTFTIWSQMVGSVGFIINSGNAGQMSVIESGGIQVDDIGIDIKVANLLQIRRVFGGGVMDTAFIRCSVGIGILIEGCSSECWGQGQTWRTNRPKFLKVVTPVEAYSVYETCIKMSQNQINNPILIDHPIRIASVGDNWGYCKDYVTGVSEPAKGTFTNSLGAPGKSSCACINNGVNAGSIDLVTNEPTMGWIDGDLVCLSNYDPGRLWVSPAFDAGFYTASAGMTWTLAAGDVATLAYKAVDKSMTLAFVLDSTTVGGVVDYVLKIRIPNGKVATKGMMAKVRATDNGNAVDAWCYVSAGGTTVDIQKEDLTKWTASANATSVQGQIVFEIN